MTEEEANESPTCPMCGAGRPVHQLERPTSGPQPIRRQQLGGCPNGHTLFDMRAAGVIG